jgi:predicted SprT family Zn-dependent metalloprotease
MTLQNAKRMARRLMNRHGLSKWSFEFNHAIHAVGHCSHFRKTIYLTAEKVRHMPVSEIRGTILHEIAHALVGRRARAHGMTWKRMAIKVGASPTACHHRYVGGGPKPAWVGSCPKCGTTWERHRAPLNVSYCECVPEKIKADDDKRGPRKRRFCVRWRNARTGERLRDGYQWMHRARELRRAN